MRIFSSLLLTLLLAASPAEGAAIAFDLRGDRLSVDAKNASVLEILTLFAAMGVDARLDPAFDVKITAAFKDKDLAKALDHLFDDVNYSARWEKIEGPLGDLHRLSEIHVYRPGHRNQAQAIGSELRGDAHEAGENSSAGYLKREILLRLKPGVSLEDARRLLRELGGQVAGSIPALGIYRIRLSEDQDIPALAEKLAGDARVAAAEPNYTIPIPESTYDATSLLPVADEASETEAPPNGAIPVAVLDSGLLSMPGLDALVLAAYDVTSMSTNMTDPVGHGTQMALIAAGVILPMGVAASGAQGVPIVAIRAFGDDGTTSNFDLIRSVNIAVENGARVMNMSWYSTAESDFLEDVIAYAKAEDVIMVAAAGNDPIGQPVYPAGFDGVIAVAAGNPDGSIWAQSNYGSFIALTAPGTAEMPIGYEGDPGLYAGTSIASAYTAGILARYLTQHPEATGEEALNALLGALTTDSGTLSVDKHGDGLLDTDAVNRLLGLESAP